MTDAIGYIHNSPDGGRINCDMNTVGQALAQFIVLEDFRVVLNDVDDLPKGDSRLNIKSQCVVGRHNINSSADHSFEAPERRWPWPDKYPKVTSRLNQLKHLKVSPTRDYREDTTPNLV